jgi:hypothetical protein
LVVIPEGDLLLFVSFALFFLILRPKIACQALESPNRFRINNIQMKKSSTPTAIIEIERKEKKKARSKRPGLFTLTQRNEDFTSRDIDCKDFRTASHRKSKPKLSAMNTLHNFTRGGGTSFSLAVLRTL